MSHMKCSQGINDLIQTESEGKPCAVNLARVAEQAVRLSADPYGPPNVRSKRRQHAFVSGEPLDNTIFYSYTLIRERAFTRLCGIGHQDSFVHQNRRRVPMIIRKAQYSVKAEYAAQNQEHIRRFMEELRALGRTDLTYSVFVEDDGKTFLHMRVCANEEALRVFDRL